MPEPQGPESGTDSSRLWSSLLPEVELRVSAAPPSRADSGPTLGKLTTAAARAHSRLLVALDGGANAREHTIRELLAEAAQLLVALADVRPADARRAEDRRAHMVAQLQRHLGAHEAGLLAGEATYAVNSHEAEEPAVRVRQAASQLSGRRKASEGDALSLQTASVELAALLVRAAANTAAVGRADEAPEPRSAALARQLRSIVRELTARADDVERPLDDSGDVVAHHLAAGLRVRVEQKTLERLGEPSSAGSADPALLDSAENAWLRLATCEYVAVTTLDPQLETSAYDERFGTLDTAIIEGAANVICGARLLGRPGAFRHHKAWGHQAIGLTYALEAYVAGLRGSAASLVQTEAIALTRLVRAVAAIQLLRLRRANSAPTNGRSRRKR
jgi:hypothetical protein